MDEMKGGPRHVRCEWHGLLAVALTLSGSSVAHAEDGDNISEVLYTTSLKACRDITEQLSLKFNGRAGPKPP